MADILTFGPARLSAVIDVVAGATTALVAARAASRTYITRLVLIVNGDQRCRIVDGATNLAVFDFPAGGGTVDIQANAGGWLWRTTANTALNLITDAAVRVSGYVEYEEKAA